MAFPVKPWQITAFLRLRRLGPATALATACNGDATACNGRAQSRKGRERLARVEKGLGERFGCRAVALGSDSEASGEMVWGGFGEVPVNKGRTSQNSIV